MLHTYVILCLTAAIAGAINAVAGGGTLLTFPALFAALTVITGDHATAAVLANGTSTVALMPGALSSFWAYRRELVGLRSWIILLGPVSLIGGLVGTFLVVYLPPELFKTLVPWLILTATTLFALQPQIARWTGIGKPHENATRATVVGIVVFQFVVAVYGGYFGAGIGILMLSALAMMGLADIHQMNALKTLLASAINGVSAAVFIASGEVYWPYAGTMAVAAIVGGYVGARVARKLDKNLVRMSVVAMGLILAAIFFYRQFAS